jgi:hypothetical protein
MAAVQNSVAPRWIATRTPSPSKAVAAGGGSKVTEPAIEIVPLNGAIQRRTASWSGDWERCSSSRSVSAWIVGRLTVPSSIGTDSHYYHDVQFEY